MATARSRARGPGGAGARRTDRRQASRQWLRAFRRAVAWHRRKLAVLAAVAAVLAGLAAATPDPPAVAEVVVVTRVLPAGTVISASDVEARTVPADALPADAETDVGSVVGRTTAGPAAEGQVLTPVHLLTVRAPSGPGQVVLPVRLADPAVVDLLSVGDRVDVLASTGEAPAARVAARDVLVVGLPPPPDDDQAAEPGVLVLVETDSRSAATLAAVSASGALTVVWG